MIQNWNLIQIQWRGFLRGPRSDFWKILLKFFLFFRTSQQKILSFYYIIWKKAPIFIFFVLKRFSFHKGTIVNAVAMRQVCLSGCLNICLGINCIKIDQFSRNLEFFFFSVSNISLHTKNWNLLLDTFYRDASKSWTFVFNYALLW